MYEYHNRFVIDGCKAMTKCMKADWLIHTGPASCLTDNQSAKMPTSHGVIQGYNAQAFVDSKHQIIVHAQAGSSQDHDNLAPMLVGAQEDMQAIGKNRDYFQGRQFTADSNYYSYANLAVRKARS